MIHVGLYKFRTIQIAYRLDYCVTCDGERITEQFRSFDAVHVWFVPLIPLGFRYRWVCPVCANDPHMRPTGLWIWFLGAISLLLMPVAVVMWLPGVFDPSEQWYMWTARLITAALLWPTMWGVKRYWDTYVTSGWALTRTLATLPLLSCDTCLYCGGPLDRERYCPKCDVQMVEIGSPYRRRW